LGLRIRPILRRVLRTLDDQESPADGENDAAPGDVARPVTVGETPSSDATIG
jgi:hypothetical protein